MNGPSLIPRPRYEALDEHGRPLWRAARQIHELPWDARKPAIVEATRALETIMAMPARRMVPFGAPIYEAFMTRPVAKAHPQAKLLFTFGADLSLDLCASYARA